MYGILYEGKLLAVDVAANSGEFCTDVAFTLTSHGENIWLVDDQAIAAKAAITNVKYYNANFETPQNLYVGKGLKVVKVELKVGA